VCSNNKPGAFEQLTGLPFVDSEALRSSTCATKCENFEACFITRDGSWSRFPQRDCEYTPVTIDNEQLAERLKSRTPGHLATTGQVLGTALRANKVYRNSFVQVLRMHEKSGAVEKGKYDAVKPNVYLTNAVRCRCVKIDENGRVKDQAPSKENIAACNPWLEMTIALVKPLRFIGVGATGLLALRPELPKGWKITHACDPGTDESPTVILSSGKAAFVMLHPSYLNRIRDNATSPAGLYDSLLNKFNATIRDCRISITQEEKKPAPVVRPTPE
jgi:uracil-DNA glycosylase